MRNGKRHHLESQTFKTPIMDRSVLTTICLFFFVRDMILELMVKSQTRSCLRARLRQGVRGFTLCSFCNAFNVPNAGAALQPFFKEADASNGGKIWLAVNETTHPLMESPRHTVLDLKNLSRKSKNSFPRILKSKCPIIVLYMGHLMAVSILGLLERYSLWSLICHLSVLNSYVV